MYTCHSLPLIEGLIKFFCDQVFVSADWYIAVEQKHFIALAVPGGIQTSVLLSPWCHSNNCRRPVSQHLTSILLYPTAVASYGCNTALVSGFSLLDDKWDASRLLDVPLKGSSILHVSLQVIEKISHQKYRQDISQIRLILT